MQAALSWSSGRGLRNRVVSGSRAAAAGLTAGDVIIGSAVTPVSSQASLAILLQGDHPGQSVSIVWLDPPGSGTRPRSLSLPPQQ